MMHKRLSLLLTLVSFLALLSVSAPLPASAQNCSILTGGNPCNAGCPDECSPFLCPGNALCKSSCGGSGCNIGCSPGPCGNGCPDECSPILCPGNALCKEECGGSSCNLTCNPGPCGAGCPDECSFVLCPSNPCSCSEAGEGCIISANCCDGLECAFPQQTCAHDPRLLGEPCGPLAPCAGDLRCGIELVCKEPSKIGEGCLIGSDCADGLDCRACFVDGCPAPFTCFAVRDDEQIFSESECLAWYSESVQQDAISSGITFSFGYGSASAGGIGVSFEVGNVYGQDGSYGCFITTCLGGTIDVEVGSFVSVGFYTSFDDFQGTSVAFIEEAGEGLVFSTSQIIGSDGGLIGTEDCLSIEASLAPITAGIFDCDTFVNSFSIEPPPTTTSTTLLPGLTTTTVTFTSTTTSTSSTLPTIELPELLVLLGRSLPDPEPEERRLRRIARKLTTLFGKAEARIAAAGEAEGKKQRRLYRKARKALRKMQTLARRGAKKDRLAVPPGPIETLAEAVLRALPAQ